MIDPKKPLRFRMPDMRPVRLVGVMPNGNMLIVSTYTDTIDATDWWPTPWIINQHGERLREGKSVLNDPFEPRVVNDVVVESGFWPLRGGSAEPHGRGMTMLSGVWEDYPTVTFAVEIVRHDGVPKEAKIHARA